MTSWTDSQTLITGAVAAITAGIAAITKWRSKGENKAVADSTLGHGWSEFSDMLRIEAAEERETRRLVEEKLSDRDKEWEECRAKLSSISRQMQGLLEWLRSMGLDPPGWINDSNKETTDDE